MRRRLLIARLIVVSRWKLLVSISLLCVQMFVVSEECRVKSVYSKLLFPRGSKEKPSAVPHAAFSLLLFARRPAYHPSLLSGHRE